MKTECPINFSSNQEVYVLAVSHVRIQSDSRQIHSGLNASTEWWINLIYENNLKHMSNATGGHF